MRIVCSTSVGVPFQSETSIDDNKRKFNLKGKKKSK
jgi:hypothetical protein